MQRKYQIDSASSIIQMNVRYKDVNSNQYVSINVGIDYANDKVFFYQPLKEDVDYSDLEQEILNFLRPPLIEQPIFSQDMMTRMNNLAQQQNIHNKWSGENEH